MLSQHLGNGPITPTQNTTQIEWRPGYKPAVAFDPVRCGRHVACALRGLPAPQYFRFGVVLGIGCLDIRRGNQGRYVGGGDTPHLIISWPAQNYLSFCWPLGLPRLLAQEQFGWSQDHALRQRTPALPNRIPCPPDGAAPCSAEHHAAGVQRPAVKAVAGYSFRPAVTKGYQKSLLAAPFSG